jgi:hypothetical protein
MMIGYVLIEVLCGHLSGGTVKDHEQIRLADEPSEIRIRHLLNTSP